MYGYQVSSLRLSFLQRSAALFLVFAGLGVISAGGQTTRSELPSATQLTPEKLSASFADVASKVEPAVVSIDTKGKAPETAARGQAAPNDSEDIMEFFRRQIRRRPSYSVGSGFIVDKSGYILTNAHVVEDAVKITVKLDSGEEHSAKVIGVDSETDLAVLKIDAAREFPAVKLGNSSQAKVGDWVLAIGSPFGLSRTVTAGIVSQTKRETPQASAFQRFIQTDAAINRGNSGGPLVNMAGEVIGINSQIATSNGDYNGVGFALPSNDALYVYDQILKNGKVRRGFLGVNLESVKPEFASVYGLKTAAGAIVTNVRDAEAATRTGLKVGDVIVEFNGEKVDNASDLIGKVSGTSPDNSINLVYLRENGSNMDRLTSSIRLGTRPTRDESVPGADSPAAGPAERAKAEAEPFGLTLVELTPTLAATYRMQGQKGLLVKEVNPDSFIADVKVSSGDALDEGDVIQRINRVAVTDTRAFNTAVSRLKKGDAVVLHVLSTGPGASTPQLKIFQFTVQ